MMKFSRHLSILALAAFVFAGTAYAQGPTKASSDNTTTQLMQSYRQKTQELRDIQQKAIKSNPKLAAEMKQLQADVNTSMRAHGYDMEKGSKRAESMIAKLKSGKKLSKAERMLTMKSFQAERQKMMKARNAAMQDPKVQKDRKAFEADMMAAMKKQDSHTGQLLKDVQALRTKIMAAMAAQRAAPKSAG
ncbi:hypothetical protein GCM10027285_20870 [Oleiagrimonas citrea]|uniref:Uncharacterized protein n=1 Tax=Oleiagrimonas citrea TaxID=1665687 RepID=A0A846ZIQ9_9GAMM|nr:hypothetical protein [Oleiagrimonas citrea]NKZ37597.1 hypothetical protein [Oleiagrimonas citrea]